MAMKRGRPGSPGVRTGKTVGPDYPDGHWRNPVNADIEEYYHPDEDNRTLESPNKQTLTLAGEKLHSDGKYDSYFGSGREPLGKGGKK